MKLQLTASALVLALAGTASFAQGMEGHQIGYNDKEPSSISFSSKSGSDSVIVEQRRVYGDGTLRAEDMHDDTVTIYPSTPDELKVERVPR